MAIKIVSNTQTSFIIDIQLKSTTIYQIIHHNNINSANIQGADDISLANIHIT
ncbi:MAG: hypothetical protein LBQ59_04120 [Candidatus Peribacteria bacterium]|jgi:hypothetical protein|nr:hypothetical protein [Candidatus Peribacteria bacterium]